MRHTKPGQSGRAGLRRLLTEGTAGSGTDCLSLDMAAQPR